MKKPDETPNSFDETYPRYPFAELVRLVLALADLIVRLRRKSGKDGPAADAPRDGSVGPRG